MTRDELLVQLHHTGVEGLAAMLAVPEARLDSGGYESGWTVRQIMAHVSSMEFTYRRLPDIASGSRDAQATAGGGTFDMDGYNARQVAKRAEATPAALIDEFTRGRARLLVEFAELDEALLTTPVRSAGGFTGTLAQVIAATAGRHIETHSADFVGAAGASPSTGDRAAAALLLAAAEVRLRLADVTADRFRRHAEGGEWSAAGICGHLIELMPYWATKLDLLSKDPTAPFSRALDAPERLGGVVNGEAMGPEEAIATLESTAAEAGAALRRLPVSAWDIEVDHPRFGRATLKECSERLLVDHAREHVGQIVRALG